MVIIDPAVTQRPADLSRAGAAVPPRVHHVVDVADVLRPLPTAGAPRVLLTVLDGGAPVGQLELVAAGDPVPVDDLVVAITNELADQLEHRRVWRRILAETPSNVNSTVAVVVCTRDRPDDLHRCLTSVLSSGRRPDQIVVVDNASTSDRTREVVASFGGQVSYVHEPEPGLDRARNRGLSIVECDIVLFTDDDVEVHASWVDRLAACFEDPAVAAAAGLVLPARLDNDAFDRFERYAGFGRGFSRRIVDPASTSPYAAGAHGAGASMAFRPAAVRDLGGFPEELDAGMPTASGGDTYVLAEMIRAGHRIVYEPAALAFHHHRSTEAELRRAMRGYGTGLGSMMLAAAVRHRDPASVLVGIPVIVRYLAVKMLRSGLHRPDSTPVELVEAEVRGALGAPKAFRHARTITGSRPPVELGHREPEPAAAPLGRDYGRPAPLIGVSVVVPTRGRRDEVVALLRSLEDQDHPDHLVEYVVVVDGDIDGSAAAVQALPLRRRLQVVVLDAPPEDPHHGNGAGTARNAGAAHAAHEILLFLDDDVRPQDRHLVAAHLLQHVTAGDGEGALQAPDPENDDCRPVAVVGPCLPSGPRRGHRPTAHEIAVRLWWSDHARRLVTNDRLDYTDFGTGNVSIRRDLFERLGGFAELPRREDWEFGRRFLNHGGRIVAADAVVFHDADYGLRSALHDRFREGQGDAVMASLDPALLHWLPLAEWWDARRNRRRLMVAALTASERALALSPAVTALLAGLDRLGLRRRHVQVKRIVNTAAYWAGVGAVLDDEGDWDELRRRAARQRSTAELSLDDVQDWVPPRPGTASEVVVTVRGRPVLVAPVSWGQLPWDRTQFLRRVLERTTDTVIADSLRHHAATSSPSVRGPQ